jgi:hypothetical protein
MRPRLRKQDIAPERLHSRLSRRGQCGCQPLPTAPIDSATVLTTARVKSATYGPEGVHQSNHDEDNNESTSSTPSTPKRAHIAPPELPRDIKLSDFHDQHIPTEQDKGKRGKQVETERDCQKWSKEDDHMLIEVVLRKLNLSESDWEQCARCLGRDEDCIQRRWKSLTDNGAVGLKSSNTRRGKNYKTW